MIPNVLQDHSAVAHQFLATRGVATCLAFVVTFVNSTLIFIEHVSGFCFISDKPTMRGTQRRLERIARNIFERAGPTAIIKSVFILGGDVTNEYRDVETIINRTHENRPTINALTNRVTTDQLRNFLNAIVTVKLQLNPETVSVGGVEEFIYYLSILVIVDRPDHFGLLMISQIEENRRKQTPEILHAAILNATSGETIVFCQQPTSNNSFSFYPNPPSDEKRVIFMRMAHQMMMVEPMKPLSQDELMDEVDKDDDISDDSDNDSNEPITSENVRSYST